jgi:hypothetical protein
MPFSGERSVFYGDERSLAVNETSFFKRKLRPSQREFVCPGRSFITQNQTKEVYMAVVTKHLRVLLPHNYQQDHDVEEIEGDVLGSFECGNRFTRT